MNYESHTVKAGNGPDLAFEGTLLGSVTSHRAGNPRWTELSLFKTKAGSYVSQVIGKSSVAGENNRYRSAHGTVDIALGIFKRNGDLTWLAKDLLEQAGIPDTTAVTIL